MRNRTSDSWGLRIFSLSHARDQMEKMKKTSFSISLPSSTLDVTNVGDVVFD